MDTYNTQTGLSKRQAFIKRSFDLLASLFGLALSLWIIIPAWLAASVDTRSNGFFTQRRIGKNGKIFAVIKIKTMKTIPNLTTTITSRNDPRITSLGCFFRKTKIDELPQLINVLLGQMSIVGPRPDVPGFADQLQESDQIILSVRPGITGPATLKYRNEETLLAQQSDTEHYNSKVIFPDKVLINRQYVENYSFWKDLYYIWLTLFH